MTGRVDDAHVEEPIDGSRTATAGPHRGAVRPSVRHIGTDAGRSESDEPVELESEALAEIIQCQCLVAIPAYNEAESIERVVEGAIKHADQVVVIDDGSDDDTADRAQSCGAAVIEHRQNLGYGAALKTAFEAAVTAGVSQLVLIDGDGQHDPADIPRLTNALDQSNAEFVIGSRFLDSNHHTVPWSRRLGLRIINGLTNLSMGVIRSESRVSDTQSGYRAFDREMIRSLAYDRSIGNRMDASTDILYHAHHHSYEIEEISVSMSYAVSNANTIHPVRHAIVLIRNILKTVERERPLSALGLPGMVLCVFGLTAGYWTVSNYVESGTFPFGHGLLTAICLVLGVFACFTAIVLHALSTYFPPDTTPRRVR
ncbi:glycosyltransferase family 2 protein [Halocatena halophila]|uniref:glycosyltransferase family 2 protein n=1 Tax=Halocatena halophila TaxID=2814576 RepID=UPI002ED05086